MSTDLNFSNIKIGYMINPDKVFYNDLDFEIIRNLEKLGASVQPFHLEEIHISINEERIEIFVGNQKVEWDGFLSYGYMSKFHYDAFLLIASAFESSNISILHKKECQLILENKLLQGFKFSAAKIPIPNTHAGFSIPALKNVVKSHYPNGGVYKKLDDYGGDGVLKIETGDGLITAGAKSLWKSEYCLFQEFVPDSLGKSVRVLCINGKAVAIAEYNDKTNNFKSNYNFGFDCFSLNSLMESDKKFEYAKLAEQAIGAIGDLVIGGVDILDSDNFGLVVLEVNGWPDLYDISHSTGIDVFELLSKAFVEKCLSQKILRRKN